MATLRAKSVSTKVTEAEYDAIARRAEPLTVSEWARGILPGATQHDPLHILQLAELLALRTIVLNLNFALAVNDPPTTEAMDALIDRADAEKLSKAEDRIAKLLAGNKSTSDEHVRLEPETHAVNADRGSRAASNKSQGDLHDGRARAAPWRREDRPARARA